MNVRRSLATAGALHVGTVAAAVVAFGPAVVADPRYLPLIVGALAAGICFLLVAAERLRPASPRTLVGVGYLLDGAITGYGALLTWGVASSFGGRALVTLLAFGAAVVAALGIHALRGGDVLPV